jgi:hypothetical protein
MSSVGIAMSFILDGLYFTASRQALGPTQPHIQWLRGLEQSVEKVFGTNKGDVRGESEELHNLYTS